MDRSERWRPMRGCSTSGLLERAATPRNGRVDLPIDARGKFDVAGAVGSGSLQVTRSSEIGQPYVGVVPLLFGRDRRRSRHLSCAIRTDSEHRGARRTGESQRRRCRGRHSRPSAAGCGRTRAGDAGRARRENATRDATGCGRRGCSRATTRTGGRSRVALTPRDGAPLRLPLQPCQSRSGHARA